MDHATFDSPLYRNGRRMYQHLSYQELITLLQNLCQERKSGFIFFSTADDAWGKIKLHEGEIIALGYASVWGNGALPLIRQITEVKGYFQTNSKSSANRDLSLLDTASLLQQLQPAGDALEAAPPTPTPSPTPPTAAAAEPPESLGDQVEAQALSELERELAAVEEEERQHSIRSPQERVILVADDSSSSRQALTRPLHASGFRVVEARDGFEAIGLAESELPDLMILDIQMPGVDGFRVLEAIRRNPRLKQTPIFLLTSKDGLMDRLKAKIADCQALLSKPVDPSNLLKQIRTQLTSEPSE